MGHGVLVCMDSRETHKVKACMFGPPCGYTCLPAFSTLCTSLQVWVEEVQLFNHIYKDGSIKIAKKTLLGLFMTAVKELDHV